MKLSALCLALLGAGASAAPGPANTWAVIAAGSKGFVNYRHQADACHAYQVLIKSGVPAEQIILMMQDDVATSPQNPFPGKLFNRNGDNATDIYDGCKVDYRGDVVTAKLFIDVITGNAAGVPAGGKVLKSTTQDRVFLNFIDHGGVNVIAFPNGPLLHSKDLDGALKSMKQKNMFNELLFYMEACESGSMFTIDKTDKIFAVTAANAHESSWGYYCTGQDKVNGKSIGACLGDLFSISWMEDAEKNLGSGETIQKQVAEVTQRVNKSHVMQFGDKSFESEPIGNFESALKAVASKDVSQLKGHAISVRDIPMESALYRADHAATQDERDQAKQQYKTIMKARQADDTLFKKVVEGACSHSLSLPIFNECVQKMTESRPALESDSSKECHKALALTVYHHCPRRFPHDSGGWNGYGMKYAKHLANICQNIESLNRDVSSLRKLIQSECTREVDPISEIETLSASGSSIIV